MFHYHHKNPIFIFLSPVISMFYLYFHFHFDLKSQNQCLTVDFLLIPNIFTNETFLFPDKLESKPKYLEIKMRRIDFNEIKSIHFKLGKAIAKLFLYVRSHGS